MLNLNISLTSLAVILWSGMMIIAGSIWILSSQVRKLADLLEEQARVADRESRPVRRPVVRSLEESPRANVLRMVERTISRAN